MPLVAAAAAVCLIGGCGPSRQAPVAPLAPKRLPSTLTGAEPCALPFSSYEAFIGFVHRPAVADTSAPTRAQLEAAYPRANFAMLAARDGRCLRLAGDAGSARGFVLRPVAVPGRRHPLLVFLRGGLQQEDRLRFADLVELAYFAERGYLVVAPEYRSNGARDELGGAENTAVRDRLDEVLALDDADSDRIVLLGVSRGAVNAFQLARERPEIRAVAALGGMVDVPATLAARPELVAELQAAIPDFERQREAALAARSAITWAKTLAIPTLLVHGERDLLVDVAQARAFASLHGDVHIEVGEGHELWGHRAEAREAVDRFFRRALLPAVYFGHLYVVLDAETFTAFQRSPFFRDQFAATDAGVPTFSPVTELTTTIYVRGHSTYLELMGPGNTFGEPLGKTGIGFNVETAGTLPAVFASLDTAGRKPSYSSSFVTFAGPDPVPWQDVVFPEVQPAPHIDLWVAEFAPTFTQWLRRAPAPLGIRRADFLASRARADRLLDDVTGLSFEVPAETLEAWVETSKAIGAVVRSRIPNRVQLEFSRPSREHRRPRRSGSPASDRVSPRSLQRV